jgi:hypothetical protein
MGLLNNHRAHPHGKVTDMVPPDAMHIKYRGHSAPQDCARDNKVDILRRIPGRKH